MSSVVENQQSKSFKIGAKKFKCNGVRLNATNSHKAPPKTNSNSSALFIPEILHPLAQELIDLNSENEKLTMEEILDKTMTFPSMEEMMKTVIDQAKKLPAKPAKKPAKKELNKIKGNFDGKKGRCCARRWAAGDTESQCENNAKIEQVDHTGRTIKFCLMHNKKWLINHKPLQIVNAKKSGLYCGTIYDTQYSIMNDDRFDWSHPEVVSGDDEIKSLNKIYWSKHPPFYSDDLYIRVNWMTPLQDKFMDDNLLREDQRSA
jgi:hypothetical protein